MVSAVWKELIMPNVKKRLNRSAMLANIPGMKLYSTIMYTMRMMKAMTNEIKPCWIDCAPSDGPTMSSCTIRAGAGIRPDLRVLARSLVSSMVKFPLISELPPEISLLTRGAL